MEPTAQAPGANPDPATNPHRTLLPEQTTDWSLDQQQALYDPGFTYPGHRAFFNGVNELSNAFVEECVTKRAELADRRRVRNDAAHRVEALRREVDGIRANEVTVRAAIETLALDAAHTEAETERAHRNELDHLERRRQASEKLNAKVPGLSLPVALLFLLGAFLFAAADYGIAHNIAGTKLDFNPLESVIFAVSIACMPLILKPALDRYVEEPHHAGGRPKFTRDFYLTVGLLALLYLGLFGWVRYEEELLNEASEIVKLEREALQTQVDLGLADAYRYSVTEIAGAIRATAKPGDVIRVYPIQANTAENTPVYDVTLPALTPSAAELKDLETKGIRSREALLADKRRAFDRAISVGAGKLQALAKIPNTATQDWTDILGAFALARNLQSAGTGTVDLHMQSDMVHSVKGDDLTRARLRDAATALALGKSSAVSFRQNALVRGLRWDQLTLHVYFPESLDRPDAYPSLVRTYWEGFAEAVGMEVVF